MPISKRSDKQEKENAVQEDLPLDYEKNAQRRNRHS